MPKEPESERREDAEPPTTAPAEERPETAELDPEALELLRARLVRKYH
jgi:hypothetical protein